MDNFYGIILAGGAGTRLWPLSRELSPKQLLELFGTDSLIKRTVNRLTKLVPEDHVVILTSERLFDEIRNHLLSGKPSYRGVRYLLEPAARNTAPAVLFAAWRIAKEDPDAVIGVFPSDHYIERDDALLAAVRFAADVARQGWLVTFGLKPERPETGFGYIEAGDTILAGGGFHALRAARFTEKPDRATAERFVNSGNFFWNSGMFVFTVRDIIEAGRKYFPEAIEALETLDDLDEEEYAERAREIFEGITAISIDYAIMEKSDRVAVIPVDIGWKDVGSLPAIEEFYEKDAAGNVRIGKIVDLDSENSIFYSDSRLVAGIGLKDMMVIDTRDATLVCPKERAQDVGKLAGLLKERSADEFLAHRYSLRPWGSFVLLEKGPNFQIKLIEVKPGMKLSEQLHNHRSEHWIVVGGTAKVTIGGEERTVHTNESVLVPIGARHRLENPGKIPLRIIEVQSGEYLGEDDIVRFDDEYGRSEAPG